MVRRPKTSVAVVAWNKMGLLPSSSSLTCVCTQEWKHNGSSSAERCTAGCPCIEARGRRGSSLPPAQASETLARSRVMARSPVRRAQAWTWSVEQEPPEELRSVSGWDEPGGWTKSQSHRGLWARGESYCKSTRTITLPLLYALERSAKPARPATFSHLQQHDSSETREATLLVRARWPDRRSRVT